MKALSLHIERLLLHHDCVVVPHFGAFVVHESAATRSEQENIFFPPSRLVRFNPDLVQDDLLLVEAVRQEQNSSLSEAKRATQAMVLDLRSQLLADGQVDFGTIGVFTQDDDGQISFSSCQAGVTTPRYYGLDAFTMPRLANRMPHAAASNTHAHHNAAVRPFRHNDDITIRISRRTLRNVAAAAAIAIICVIFTSPFQMSDVKGGQASVFSSSPKVENTQQTKAEEKPAATDALVNEEIPTAQNATAAEEKAVEEKAIEEKTTQEAPYAVVLASQVSRKNADAFVQRLQDMGYANARVHDNGKMLRVVIDGLATETDAANLAHQIHLLGGDYAAAWVLKL